MGLSSFILLRKYFSNLSTVTPTLRCPHSKRGSPKWEALEESVVPRKVTFLGSLSRSSLSSYWSSLALSSSTREGVSHRRGETRNWPTLNTLTFLMETMEVKIYTIIAVSIHAKESYAYVTVLNIYPFAVSSLWLMMSLADSRSRDSFKWEKKVFRT